MGSFVARLRNRVQNRLWKRLLHGITGEQRTRLEELLTVPPHGRSSWLDKLRSGPVRISGPALVNAIHRAASRSRLIPRLIGEVFEFW